MTLLRFSLLCACLMVTAICVSAQTTSSEPRAGATPDPEDKSARTVPAKKIDPETVVELGASYEFVNKGRPDWQTYYWSINHKFSTGQVLYGTASAVRRFETTDPNFMIGYVQPLGESKRWIATFEAGGSPNHQILPTTSFYGQVERILPKGWIARAGLRNNRYLSDTLNMGVLGAERYFKAYRAAYTLYVAHLNGKGTALSHAFQGSYYYGERNSVGAGFAFGQEIESVPGGLVKTDVLDFSLTGRHWMTNKWGLSYVAVWHRQGELYTRSGAQIGLLLRF
jgi:YaiO family outer membrane protein